MSGRRAALAAAAAELAAAGVPDPAREARLLLRWASGLSPAALAAAPEAPLGPVSARRLAAACRARAARQPLSQITGARLFWGRRFRVTPDVLDPRPETEALIAAALEAPYARILDLGTGSGCLLLTLLAERPAATGIGTDLSGPALTVAAETARRLGLTARAGFLRADWCRGVPGRFDLIVSNPPYIAGREIAGLAPEVAAHEPRGALTPAGDPGGDGLGAYRRIAAEAGPLLAPGGRLLLELGRGQAPAVAEILAAEGFAPGPPITDLDGTERALRAVRR